MTSREIAFIEEVSPGKLVFNRFNRRIKDSGKISTNGKEKKQ